MRPPSRIETDVEVWKERAVINGKRGFEYKEMCEKFATALNELKVFFDKFGKGNVTSKAINKLLAEYEHLRTKERR